MNIEAVANNVIFQFTDETLSTRFVNSTASGILFTPQDIVQSDVPRWGRVTHVGPEVTEVGPGDVILVDKGRWTQGFYVGGARYWKTDPTEILATADEPGTTY